MKIKSAKITKVIQVIVSTGKGTEKDPVRCVMQYWDLNGKLIYEKEHGSSLLEKQGKHDD